MKTLDQLSTFERAYLECALWSSTDNATESGGEPLDASYGIEDIAPETLERMIADCQEFQNGNPAKLDYVSALCGDARAGHNFWLNRNGHGAGFWDEYFGTDKEMHDSFVALSDASKAWGSFDLYIGDDGLIHGS